MEHEHKPTSDAEYVLLRRVAVKFLDEIDRLDQFKLPYEDGAEQYLPDEFKKSWDVLFERYSGITLKPVYTVASPDRIQQLVAEAEKLDESYKAPDFLTFFAIDTPSLEAAMEIASQLAEWKGVVEYAYVQPLSSLPAISLNQKYIDAPIPHSSGINNIGGVDAMYAWNHAINTSMGADSSWGVGKGIQFADIEKGWDLTHLSLQNRTPKVTVLPTLNANVNRNRDTSAPAQQFFNGKHGTNVLGILVANDSAAGWKGIAEQATGYVISIYWDDPNSIIPSAIIESVEQAIMAAIDRFNPGDVILLELETQVSGFGSSFWPIECVSNVFAAIRLATARGITVIEAAGNSGCDFDSTLTSTNPNPPATPFNSNPNNNPYFNQDSGAIIVGASTVTGRRGSVKGSRSQSSNYGNRVNCFAWGDSVHTLDIDVTSGVPISDRTDFSGTSAASAIVAGAAIILQAVAKHKGWGPFAALRLRDILSNPATGTLTSDSTVANPNVDKIGVMPNLKLIIEDIVRNTAPP